MHEALQDVEPVHWQFRCEMLDLADVPPESEVFLEGVDFQAQIRPLVSTNVCY